MPYSGPDDDNLPDRIKAMSEETRKKWVGAWNGAFKNCMDKDTAGGPGTAKECEGTAFKFANAAVKEVLEADLKEITMAEQKLSEVVTKQVTRTEDGIEFKASDYAVVPDPEKPSTWKLRLAESEPGDFTVKQVAMAITAMQPGGFRGQRVELSADDKKQAISRISAAIGKSGGDDTQKENLRERLDKVKEKGIIEKTIEGSKTFLLGQPSAEPEQSGFKLYKQADGTYRWFATVSNHFRDKDNPPEIIEAKAHRDYIAYLDNGGEFPETWLWHTPGTKWGKADWADFSDGFLMMSGTVDADKEAIARSLEACEGLKVSHGFVQRYSSPEKGLIGWYRTFEVSPLPSEDAANPWTGMEILMKEAKMPFDAKKREFLVTHMGEDKVAELEGNTAEMAKALVAMGIEYKEGEPSEPFADALVKALTEADPDQVAQAAAQAVVASEGFKALTDAMAEFKAGVDQIPDILKRLKEVEKSDDAKIAAALTAPASKVLTGHRASQSEETVKEGEDGGNGPTLPDDWKDTFTHLVVGAPSSE